MTKTLERAKRDYVDAGSAGMPPEEGGQIVQTSWCCTEDFTYAVTIDRSDRSTTITAYRNSVSDEWEPWNRVPPKGRKIGSWVAE